MPQAPAPETPTCLNTGFPPDLRLGPCSTDCALLLQALQALTRGNHRLRSARFSARRWDVSPAAVLSTFQDVTSRRFWRNAMRFLRPCRFLLPSQPMRKARAAGRDRWPARRRVSKSRPRTPDSPARAINSYRPRPRPTSAGGLRDSSAYHQQRRVRFERALQTNLCRTRRWRPERTELPRRLLQAPPLGRHHRIHLWWEHLKKEVGDFHHPSAIPAGSASGIFITWRTPVDGNNRKGIFSQHDMGAKQVVREWN